MAADPTVPSPTPNPEPVRPLRVLYADDVRELRELITHVLARDGHRVETVQDGRLAWERLSTDAAYDLLITDHHMPNMNGLELVRHVKGSPYRGKIVVFSSELSPIVHARYRAYGVDLVMPKPVFPPVLRKAIRELFAPQPV